MKHPIKVFTDRQEVTALGVGDRLGLTQMGEIKMQLAQDAQEDAANATALVAADAEQTEIAQPSAEPRQTHAAPAKEDLVGERIESLDVASRTEPAGPPEETTLSEKPTVEIDPVPSVDQGERL